MNSGEENHEEEKNLNQSLYEWTNLPGYFLRYLHGPGTRKIRSNPEAFEIIQSLLKVPTKFYEKHSSQPQQETRTRTIWYINLNHKWCKNYNKEIIGLEKEIKQTIYFLGLNSNYKIKEISLDSNRISNQINSSKDWIIFSSINFNLLLQLSSGSYGSDCSEEDLKEIHQSFKVLKSKHDEIGCMIGVLGVWEDEMKCAEKIKTIRAENIRFVEVWKKDYLITFTSQAAIKHPKELKTFFQRLKHLDFNPEDSSRFISWLHLLTFHQLNPNTKPNQALLRPPSNQSQMNEYLSKLRTIQIISKTFSWPSIFIKDTFRIPKDSFYLSKHFIQEKVEDCFDEVLGFEEVWENSMKLDEDDDEVHWNEVKNLCNFSGGISNSVWDFKGCVVVVSDLEKTQFGHLERFSCKMMKFDEVLRLMDKEEVEI